MAQLRLKDINKIYDNGFHAVHNFNMDIAEGEFIVFVGPSGCGKSTTLRMIAGLEEISDGQLFIGGQMVNHMSPRDRGIAMVFQSYALYPHMTVYENMAFGLTLKGIDEDIIEGRVKRTAKILGLENYLDRLPRELSGGQRQRVAVGRAIIRHVEVFLMDEPLSNLDAKQRVTMRAEIIQIHRKIGATTIYVTHDQTEAMTMADRIVVMKDGFIQQIGTPYDLYFHPANQFVAGFIGEPPMNFVECKVEKNTAFFLHSPEHKPDIPKIFPKLLKKEGFTLGFRPEAIELLKDDVPPGGMVIQGEVEITEMLGDGVNLYLNVGGHKIIAKTTIYDVPEMGEVRKFFVAYENIHFFDEKSGNVLSKKEG